MKQQAGDAKHGRLNPTRHRLANFPRAEQPLAGCRANLCGFVGSFSVNDRFTRFLQAELCLQQHLTESVRKPTVSAIERSRLMMLLHSSHSTATRRSCVSPANP